jgi:hypothetical protein
MSSLGPDEVVLRPNPVAVSNLELGGRLLFGALREFGGSVGVWVGEVAVVADENGLAIELPEIAHPITKLSQTTKTASSAVRFFTGGLLQIDHYFSNPSRGCSVKSFSSYSIKLLRAVKSRRARCRAVQLFSIVHPKLLS